MSKESTNLKLNYFILYSGNSNIGPYNKIFSQARILNSMNQDTKVLLVGGSELDYPHDYFINYIEIKELNSLSKSGIFRRLKLQHKMNQILKELIASLSSNDILLLRYPPPMFFLFFNKRKADNCKIIIEYNSLLPTEFKMLGDYPYFILDTLFGTLFRKKIDGIIGVTDEITEHEVTRAGYPFKPHITIGNGLDVNNFPVRYQNNLSDNNLDLLCVANVSHWHGLDRVIKGLATYKGRIVVRLHIVGEGKKIESLKELVIHHGVNHLVIFHGYLVGKKLDGMFDQCHVAVGSLGIHRLGIMQASVLKVREYIARGIPVIYSGIDKDFPNDYPYILRIKADESSIDIDEVIDFAKRVYSDPLHPIKMRDYALKALDWSIKLMVLKDFCDSFDSN